MVGQASIYVRMMGYIPPRGLTLTSHTAITIVIPTSGITARTCRVAMSIGTHDNAPDPGRAYVVCTSILIVGCSSTQCSAGESSSKVRKLRCQSRIVIYTQTATRAM